MGDLVGGLWPTVEKHYKISFSLFSFILSKSTKYDIVRTNQEYYPAGSLIFQITAKYVQ